MLSGYRLTVPPHGFEAHPAILDGALQSAAALLAHSGKHCLFLPAAIGAVRVWRAPAAQGHLHVRSVHVTARDARFNVLITDEKGEVTAELRDCRMRRADILAVTAVRQASVVLRAATHPGAIRPVPLPAPQELVAATAAAHTGPTDDGLTRFLERLRESTAHWSAHAFAQLLPTHTRFDLDDLRAAGMPERYAAQASLLADLAVDHGLLSAASDSADSGWKWRTASDAGERARALLADHPGMAALLAVHQRCGLRLAAVLRGERDPRELFTTEGDRHLWERFQARTLHPAVLRSARSLLMRALTGRPADSPLRVLEIGAGAGDLSAELLPLLPPELTEYVFTDRSADTFPRAQARLEAHDFVDYRTLDLDAPEALDARDALDAHHGGAAVRELPGAYDLVISSGALQRAKAPAAAARRVGRMLAEGGLLLALDRGPLHHTALFQGLFDTTSPAPACEGAETLRSALRDARFCDITADVTDEGAGSVLLAHPPRPEKTGTPASAPGTAAALPALSGRWLLLSESAATPLPPALAAAVAEAARRCRVRYRPQPRGLGRPAGRHGVRSLRTDRGRSGSLLCRGTHPPGRPTGPDPARGGAGPLHRPSRPAPHALAGHPAHRRPAPPRTPPRPGRRDRLGHRAHARQRVSRPGRAPRLAGGGRGHRRGRRPAGARVPARLGPRRGPGRGRGRADPQGALRGPSDRTPPHRGPPADRDEPYTLELRDQGLRAGRPGPRRPGRPAHPTNSWCASTPPRSTTAT